MNTRDQRTFAAIKKQVGTIVEDLRRLRDRQPEQACMDRNYLDNAEVIAIELHLFLDATYSDDSNQKSH